LAKKQRLGNVGPRLASHVVLVSTVHLVLCVQRACFVPAVTKVRCFAKIAPLDGTNPKKVKRLVWNAHLDCSALH
jgi:hypothetical protein